MPEPETRTLLVVDDEKDLLVGLKRLIEPEMDGITILTASSAKEALSILSATAVDAVLSDILMPEMDGIEFLKRIRDSHPEIQVILMTAFGTIDLAVEALKLGAYDFITKPLDEERLLHTIRRCLELSHLSRRAASLEKRLQEREDMARFVGSSPALSKALSTIRLVAKTDVTVLITGESGTGKELAARTIHDLSDRSRREFIAVNCPAIPESILESELFGYRKGAFTQATQDKKGLFDAAHEGTILLDEIGDLPLALQTKLLRVLQEKEYIPLGDTRPRKVDVRIIASTNQDLWKKMRDGTFRDDLYYRLNVVSIRMPPLREMREDIPALALFFLEKAVTDLGLPPKTLSPASLRCISDAPWKGNVRELANVVKKAAILSPGPTIEPEDLAIECPGGPCASRDLDALTALRYPEAKALVLEDFTTRYLTTILERTEGNVTQAARESGIERQAFQQLMRKYGIRSEAFRK